jgi:DNA-directed RNA polymerase alpha subunit
MQEKLSLPLDSFLAGIEIDALKLSIRSYNALRRSGRTCVLDVLNTPTEHLKRIRNLGYYSLCEILEKLNEFLIDNYKTTLKEYHSVYHNGEEELYGDYR